MTSGLITAALMAAFAGIAYWAFAKRNRPRFEEAAQLPLNDEPADCPPGGCRCKPQG